MARKSLAISPAEEIRLRINLQMHGDVLNKGSDVRYSIQRVPSGSLVIDRLTGGGFARGRHSLLYGDFMAGKSLIVYQTLALAQARGEVCALVDGEHVFDEAWFKAVGGDPDALLLYEPENANQLGNVLKLFIDRAAEVRPVDIVGIDSVASMLPKEELDYDMESESDVRVGSLARLMSLLLRQVTTMNDQTVFLWTNQWRDKISRIPGLKSTPGGHALGFYASTIIEMMQGDKETDKADVPYKGAMVARKRVNGRWVNCTLKKEKTGGRPEDSMSFMLDYNTRRIDREREIIDLGMHDDLIVRKGDYYEITPVDDEGLAIRTHGIKRAVDKLRDEALNDWLVSCIEEQTAALFEVEA